MSIDLHALANAATGDPESKVAVKRKWLAEVHKELKALQSLRTQRELGDRIATLGDKIWGLGLGH